MNILKRAVLYVIRKRSRTILLLFILFVVSTLTLSGLSIVDATTDSSNQLRESTGTGFTMKQNLDTASKQTIGNTTSYNQEHITDDMIKKIVEIDGIKGYNAKQLSVPSLQSADGKDLDSIVYCDWYDDIPFLKSGVSALGSLNTNYDSYFTNNAFQLVEGRHINDGEKNVALISKELAKKYNYQVGDTIKLVINNEMVEAKKQFGVSDMSASDVDVEIIGIFDILIEQSDKDTLVPYELYENQIFYDMTSLKNLHTTWPEATKEFEAGYLQADFFVTDPKKLESVISKVSSISSIDWDNFTLVPNDTVARVSSSSMSNVEKLIITMIIVVIVISTVIIYLILFMWMQSRQREAGILIANGISKFSILSQYILEIVTIDVVAFGLAYFVSNGIASAIAQLVGANIENQVVHITLSNFILVSSGGLLLILIAVGISSIPIIRMQPRTVLSKMS